VKGQAGYTQLLMTLIEQAGATSCVNDDDCSLLPSSPKCGNPCPGTPVSVAIATEVASELGQWEEANCSTCTPLVIPCPALPPACVDGTCLPYHPF